MARKHFGSIRFAEFVTGEIYDPRDGGASIEFGRYGIGDEYLMVVVRAKDEDGQYRTVEIVVSVDMLTSVAEIVNHKAMSALVSKAGELK